MTGRVRKKGSEASGWFCADRMTEMEVSGWWFCADPTTKMGVAGMEHGMAYTTRDESHKMGEGQKSEGESGLQWVRVGDASYG